MKKLNILGICGSLRAGSLNSRALLAVKGLAGDDVNIEVAAISDIPLYNGDLGDPPDSVERLKKQIASNDGLLIATPEYNYGIPGVLKNAIDWVSRPAYKSVLAQKPVAIMGASPGAVGTARAQGQLKQVLLGTASEVFPFPEVTLGQASEKLSEDGSVTDERTSQQLKRFIDSYAEWLRRFVR
jgi:chromate reductase, NAD(P)H dehydrogenase (quinone)